MPSISREGERIEERALTIWRSASHELVLPDTTAHVAIEHETEASEHVFHIDTLTMLEIRLDSLSQLFVIGHVIPTRRAHRCVINGSAPRFWIYSCVSWHQTLPPRNLPREIAASFTGSPAPSPFDSRLKQTLPMAPFQRYLSISVPGGSG